MEAAKKLANESELCKTVKKKRRRNCLDAMQKLQQIEDEMNQYRVKKGKKPTQRASVIIAGAWCRVGSASGSLLGCFLCAHPEFRVSPDELVRSDCSSLSSLPLDDGESDKALAEHQSVA